MNQAFELVKKTRASFLGVIGYGTDGHLPQLLVDIAETAVHLQQYNVAYDALEIYFGENPPKDQVFINFNL